MNLKIGLTGSKGFIGRHLLEYPHRDVDGTAENSYEIIPILSDVTDVASLSQEITKVDPDVVLNLAAMTSVEDCEKDKVRAVAVNARGAYNVAKCAREINAMVVYLSSDHVFSGKKLFPNGYQENDVPSPITQYGFSKWGGEVETAVAHPNGYRIIRTSRVFNYTTFATEMSILVNDAQLEVPGFIYKSFLHVDFFCKSLLSLVMTANYKSYPSLLHMSSIDVVSYYDFWLGVAKRFDFDPKLVVKRTKDIGTFSPRPLKSGLQSGKLIKYGLPVYTVSQSIDKMWQEMYNGD